LGIVGEPIGASFATAGDLAKRTLSFYDGASYDEDPSLPPRVAEAKPIASNRCQQQGCRQRFSCTGCVVPGLSVRLL